MKIFRKWKDLKGTQRKLQFWYLYVENFNLNKIASQNYLSSISENFVKLPQNVNKMENFFFQEHRKSINMSLIQVLPFNLPEVFLKHKRPSILLNFLTIIFLCFLNKKNVETFLSENSIRKIEFTTEEKKAQQQTFICKNILFVNLYTFSSHFCYRNDYYFSTTIFCNIVN